MMVMAIRNQLRQLRQGLDALGAVLGGVADDDLPPLAGARALVGLADLGDELDRVADALGGALDPADLSVEA